MNVVSDDSPLIVLAKAEWLDLVPFIHPHVFISAEAYSEVVMLGSGLPGSSEVEAAEWIEVEPWQTEVSSWMRMAAGNSHGSEGY